jgi:hypothetical protein
MDALNVWVMAPNMWDSFPNEGQSWACPSKTSINKVLHIIFIIPMTVNDVNLSVAFRGVSGLSS